MLAAEIHADVCRRGFDPQLGSFVQSYGGKQLDASLLLMPEVGFLPPEDARVRGTVAGDRAAPAGRRVRHALRHARNRRTACRRARARSWPAASGWSTPTSCRTAGPMRAACSTDCWACATMSACSAKNTIRARDGWSAISRRPSRMSRWSTARSISRVPKSRRSSGLSPNARNWRRRSLRKLDQARGHRWLEAELLAPARQSRLPASVPPGTARPTT